MRKQYIYGAVILLTVISTLFSCRKKEDPVIAPQGTGTLKVEFSNVVGNEALGFDHWYKNENQDSFKISTYKYYISNVSVATADGKTFDELESFHLIDQEDAASHRFSISNVPAGNYTSVTFLIGVDSARNVQGAQSGSLDPGHGMLWTWNTGYIMAKMEGMSPSSGDANKALTFHIAGFSGEYNVLRKVTLTFPEPAKVTTSNSPNVHIFSDALEWFKTPETIHFADNYFIMTTGETAKRIADNYTDMFHVDHVDN